MCRRPTNCIPASLQRSTLTAARRFFPAPCVARFSSNIRNTITPYSVLRELQHAEGSFFLSAQPLHSVMSGLRHYLQSPFPMETISTNESRMLA